ncbi:hypothetical protein KAR91_79420 [Candidatus Pacearchaeota archaeon]|nr:hypothetical protein [Candidatus Pacearchaeota archaeon]
MIEFIILADKIANELVPGLISGIVVSFMFLLKDRPFWIRFSMTLIIFTAFVTIITIIRYIETYANII